MKIRSGFVSNSSSSSFCLVGYKLTREEVSALYNEDTDGFYEEEDFDTLYDDYSECYYAGNLLANGDDTFEVALEDITNNNEKIEKVAKKFNKSKSDVKIYGGTIEC